MFHRSDVKEGWLSMGSEPMTKPATKHVTTPVTSTARTPTRTLESTRMLMKRVQTTLTVQRTVSNDQDGTTAIAIQKEVK